MERLRDLGVWTKGLAKWHHCPRPSGILKEDALGNLPKRSCSNLIFKEQMHTTVFWVTSSRDIAAYCRNFQIEYTYKMMG